MIEDDTLFPYSSTKPKSEFCTYSTVSVHCLLTDQGTHLNRRPIRFQTQSVKRRITLSTPNNLFRLSPAIRPINADGRILNTTHTGQERRTEIRSGYVVVQRGICS